MDKYEIKSYQGIGNINFGEDRSEIRNKLGLYKEFKKSKFSKNTTDDFRIFHVFYSAENKVNAVEFFPESNLKFCNISLFANSYKEIINQIEDSNIEEDETGIIFKTLGFSLFSPNKDKIESILVFEKGYYD